MSTRSTDDFTVRLRQAAGTVPPATMDVAAVLRGAKKARHRRRARGAAAGAGAIGLLVAALGGIPLDVPAIGTVTVSGAGPFRHGQPSSTTLTRETTALQQDLLPVLRQLRVTWFDKSCDGLDYTRGVFSRDGRCSGRPGEHLLDTAARADVDRILKAIDDGGVATDKVTAASYSTDGQVIFLRIRRAGGGITWDYAYIYSPTQQPAQEQTALGPTRLTPIGTTGWYFEKTPND